VYEPRKLPLVLSPEEVAWCAPSVLDRAEHNLDLDKGRLSGRRSAVQVVAYVGIAVSGLFPKPRLN
jgi:hypothetical protein